VQLQQAWAEILDDPQLAWAILAQCLGAVLLARMLAGGEARQQVLDASLNLLQGTLEPVG
jgi:TetR/AcrR family transcriptional repressor of nem operon